MYLGVFGNPGGRLKVWKWSIFNHFWCLFKWKWFESVKVFCIHVGYLALFILAFKGPKWLLKEKKLSRYLWMNKLLLSRQLFFLQFLFLPACKQTNKLFCWIPDKKTLSHLQKWSLSHFQPHSLIAKHPLHAKSSLVWLVVYQFFLSPPLPSDN